MLKLIFTLIFLYLLIVTLFYLFQRKLIYFPSPGTVHPRETIASSMQEVTLTTSDNLKLTAWYKAPKQKNQVIVYFHGNAGHIGHRALLVSPFLEHGYGVLLVSYRGYSKNPGWPSEKGLYLDGIAAMNFLQKEKIPMKHIVLYGESIGSAVAIEIAKNYPVDAVILQSPFTSLADIGRYHYPFLPVDLIVRDRFENLKKIADLKCRILILQPENDEIIPNFMAKELFQKAQAPKELVVVPLTGHNDLISPKYALHFLSQQISGDSYS